MGRPKSYERDCIARKAMEVFWRHGFHGTSTQALVDAMGVNRFSLYAEFGNKQALYEAALTLYELEVVGPYFLALESLQGGLKEMEDLFTAFASSAGQPGSEMGCFACNAATDRAADDSGVRLFVHAYVQRISAAFTHGLRNARKGFVGLPAADVVSEGYYLATIVVGFFVLLRAQVAPDVLRAAAHNAMRHIRYLTMPVRVPKPKLN